MKIQICFLKRNDILSRIVRYLSKGRYSHSFVSFDSLTIAETDFIHNLRLRLNPYKKCDYDAIALDLKPVQIQEAMEWIEESNGKQYDNLQNYLWLIKKGDTDENQLNCVEMCIDLLAGIGYLTQIYRSMNLSPTQLYEILERKSIN